MKRSYYISKIPIHYRFKNYPTLSLGYLWSVNFSHLAIAVRPDFTNHDVVGTDLLTVSAEGRVEHQKLNQTAP